MVIRGCSTSINKFGFYNRTLELFDRYDICRDIKASDLFRYEADSQTINVCSCLGDRCNGISVNASGRSHDGPKTLLSLLIAAFVSLFSSSSFSGFR